MYVENRRILHMLFHRALLGRPYYGGSVLLRKFFGELNFDCYFFDPMGRFIPLDALFQKDLLRIDVTGFAELKDVVSGAGSQRDKKKFKRRRRRTVSTVLPGLIGVDGEGTEMGVYPGSSREINGYFHNEGLSCPVLFLFGLSWLSVYNRFQLMLQPPLGVQFDVPGPPSVETEAKHEIFSSRLELLHSGHCISLLSDDLRTSRSNSLPHSRQINS
jgi:hypothetical protein